MDNNNLIHSISAIFTNRKTRYLLFLFSLSWLYAICSQVVIWLPFGWVPVSLQPLPLYIAVVVFGWHAIYAYLLYILQGVCGAPFFAGSQGGFARLLGPTGGYLVGFFFAMVFLQYLLLHRKKKRAGFMLGVYGAQIIVFCFGLLQLSLFVPSDILFSMGFYPFALGDFALKPLLAFFCIYRLLD